MLLILIFFMEQEESIIYIVGLLEIKKNFQSSSQPKSNKTVRTHGRGK